MADLDTVQDARDRLERRLASRLGFRGVGIVREKTGDWHLQVQVDAEQFGRLVVPHRFRGVHVETVEAEDLEFF